MHLGAFSTLENKLIGYADDSTLMAVVPSPCALEFQLQSPCTVTSARLVSGVIWEMKETVSKTMTMIVSRSRTMHPQSPPLTIGGTVLKESDNLDILKVVFDSKMTFVKHLRSVSLQLLKGLVFLDILFLGRCFRGFVLPVLEYCSAAFCSAAHTLLKLLDRVVTRRDSFLTRRVFECDIAHRRSVAVLLTVCCIRSGVTRCPNFIIIIIAVSLS